MRVRAIEGCVPGRRSLELKGETLERNHQNLKRKEKKGSGSKTVMTHIHG